MPQGSSANISIRKDIVEQITLQMDVTLPNIIDGYGAPSYMLSIPSIVEGFFMIYREHGLVVTHANDSSDDSVFLISLVSDNALNKFYRPVINLAFQLDNCSTFIGLDCLDTTTTSALPSSLQSILTSSSPRCLRACWLGLETGVATEEQLEATLDRLNFNYEISITSDGITSYFLNLDTDDLSQLPFINNNPIISTRNGTITEIYLPVANVPLEMVLDDYGAPTRVFETELNGILTIELIYPDNDLLFYVSTHSGVDTVDSIILRDAFLLLGYYAVPPDIRNFEDCTIFEADPCPVATATREP
jgi:hypothetical protein